MAFSDADFTHALHHKDIDGATLSFDTEGGTVYLYSLRVPSRHRGQGLAKNAMREFMDAVDLHNLAVKLVASPLDKRTSLSRLVKFYQEWGFVVGQAANLVGHPWMHRASRRQNDMSTQLNFTDHWVTLGRIPWNVPAYPGQQTFKARLDSALHHAERAAKKLPSLEVQHLLGAIRLKHFEAIQFHSRRVRPYSYPLTRTDLIVFGKWLDESETMSCHAVLLANVTPRDPLRTHCPKR